jgi:hypothetical protein
MSNSKEVPTDVEGASCPSRYAAMIGKRFLTPYPQTEGVVTVLAIHNPVYPFDVPLASVRFEGDHPAGYKDGTYGMYEACMLRDLPRRKLANVHEQIHAKCRQCGYGEAEGNRTICRNQLHPGYVGGCGTEWVLYCDRFCAKSA